MTSETLIKTVSTKTTSLTQDSTQKSKIEKLQEHDKWKSDQSRQVPIQVTHINLTAYEHDRLEVSVESANGSCWTTKISLKQLKRFANEMDEVFPIETGSVAKHKRVLPVLDLHKPLFGSKRPVEKMIETYLKGLTELPSYILQSKIVVDLLLGDGPVGSRSGSDASYASSIKTPSITKSTKLKSKIKLNIDGDLVMIHVNEDRLTIDQFACKIMEKLGLPVCPPSCFTYEDAEGDVIRVFDDEDLAIALELYPTLLNLTHISA